LFAGYYNPNQLTQGGTTDPLEFPGVIDEIRILNYVRTPQEISDTWFGTNNSFGSLKTSPGDKTVSTAEKGNLLKPPNQIPINTPLTSDTVPKETRVKRDAQKEERR